MMEFLGSGILDFNSLPSPVDKFELLGIIGEGTYGEVHLALELDSEIDRRVAVKILENLVENLNEAENEYLVLKELSIHPNLPFFHGLFYKASPKPENSQLWFVMEYCSGGSVTDLAQGLKKYENRALTELQLAYILREVIDALLHLHQNKVIHRDVKGHNILLTQDGGIKLIDFGVAANIKTTLEKRNTSTGSPFWMPPEVIACERQGDINYDARCDVWSLGITAIELAEGEPPLADLHPMRALFQIPRNPPPKLSKPDNWSTKFSNFISDCLIKNIEMRPWMCELRKESFITQIGISTDIIRKSIVNELELIKTFGNIRREPEVTTKYGKLKNDRKKKLQTMFVDDLASLATTDEETILEQLYQRFEQKNIYTYVGDIFIIINPYENLGLYTDFYQFKYRGSSIADVSPHIFGVADQAYHTMLHRKKNQALIISGESGSGKTEATYHILQQLVYLGKAPNRNLEMKLLQINPILEAFGNAFCSSNSNSSRFIKYLNVTFSRTGKVTGAEIFTYLIEDSRITKENNGESNFHIFSYLLEGMKAQDAGSLSKLFKEKYNYIPESLQKPSVSPVEKFQQLQKGFHLLGFNADEVFSIYEILIGILHLGEIEFESENNGNEECGIINKDELKIVATLLGVSVGDLGIGLTSKKIEKKGKNECCIRRNTIKDGIEIRNSLARTLYNRLFQWIVHQINALLRISSLAYDSKLCIGILDIFGFHSLPTNNNSMEQLIINSTNEYLQYYINMKIFVWGQQEYMVEGINTELVKYGDTKDILDLLLGSQHGIFSIIQQEALLPGGNDKNLISNLNLNCEKKKYYRKSREYGFEVRHYVKRVRYNVHGFCKKNRGWNSKDLTELLSRSTNHIVRTMFRSIVTKTGNIHITNRKESIMNSGEEPKTEHAKNTIPILASQCRHALVDLISKLLTAQPHFIRCIKPNNHSIPNSFDLVKVLQQLRYTGIMDCIQIRQTGYSHRFTFVDFLMNYCFLGFSYDERVVADRESCRLLLLRLNLDGWILGKTKVFLKYYHVEYLEKLCDEEMLSKIVSYLENSTRQSVRLVCKRWYFLISAIYNIQLELNSQNWNILSKCWANYLALGIRGVPSPLLTEAELILGVVPLCERLIHLEFSGIISYENIRKAIIFCHRLISLSFNKIEFDKKRQTAIASKARSGIYFQANETHAALLPELVMLQFILIGREPDELHLVHFLSAIVNKGGLQFFIFEIFREILFDFGQIEYILGNPPFRSPTTSALNSSGSKFGEVLKYDACVEKIISTSIDTLEIISLKIMEEEQMRELSAEFVPELRPIPKFKKFAFLDYSSLLHTVNNGPWLHALKSQSELTELELDIFFNEIPDGVSSFLLIKEIIASNAQSLTTIYLDCDFPEFREPIPQWECRTFSACVNLESLTLDHWQYHQARWMGNFNQIHLCPKLIGLEYLPPNIKNLRTTMTILLPGESLTEFHFPNLRKLEELEMNSIPWFLTADGYFKRINRNRYNHLLDEMPKLKKIAGTVKGTYFANNGHVRHVSSVTLDFFLAFRMHIQQYGDESSISMKIMRNVNVSDTSED